MNLDSLRMKDRLKDETVGRDVMNPIYQNHRADSSGNEHVIGCTQMKIEDRKAWERKQRQDRIIDIAEKLFLSQGVNQTTMDRIAHVAG